MSGTGRDWNRISGTEIEDWTGLECQGLEGTGIECQGQDKNVRDWNRMSGTGIECQGLE